MIQIQDPGMRRIILEYMADAKPENIAPKYRDFVRSLRKRPLDDLIQLSKQGCFDLEVSINPEQCLQALTLVDGMSSYNEVRDYFVLHEAPTAMLMEYFKVSSGNIKELRERFVKQKRVGRPRLPKSAERDEIHVVWAQLISEPSSDSTYINPLMKLHAKYPQHSIQSLWSSIHEFTPELLNNFTRKKS